MNTKLRFSFAALCAASLAACGGGAGDATRDSVKVVGSSTVYPFAKLVAENFARSHPDLGSPIIESTGTGGGIELFCKGVGAEHPGHRQRLAADEGERVRDLPGERRDRDHRDPGRPRRPRLRLGAGRHQDEPDARDRLPRARRASVRRGADRARPGTTSIRRCPTCRSWSTARPRPRARATRSRSWS